MVSGEVMRLYMYSVKRGKNLFARKRVKEVKRINEREIAAHKK